MKTIKAAKIHFAIFGVNGEEKYLNKPVTLNGIAIGILPTSPKHNLDAWNEAALDVPKDKLSLLAADNVTTVTNCGGDCFKMSDIGLAVQLPDGTWVESSRDLKVYCSVGPGWLYFEGTPFKNNASPEIKLALPVQ